MLTFYVVRWSLLIQTYGEVSQFLANQQEVAEATAQIEDSTGPHPVKSERECSLHVPLYVLSVIEILHRPAGYVQFGAKSPFKPHKRLRINPSQNTLIDTRFEYSVYDSTVHSNFQNSYDFVDVGALGIQNVFF
jgi:hypothetical protein